MRYLVRELGTDVNQAWFVDTPLRIIMATRGDDLAMVQCLAELGVDIGVVNDESDDDTALHTSAYKGRYSTMYYLLEDCLGPDYRALQRGCEGL
jgi:hypothetical protein